MHFRQVLDLIVEFYKYGTKGFTSVEFSSELGALYSDKIPDKEIAPKRISNDLDRLYCMDLLKRKRRKRMVVDQYGNDVNKGFEYVYSLSSQGRKYHQYLHGTEEKREPGILFTVPPKFGMPEKLETAKQEKWYYP